MRTELPHRGGYCLAPRRHLPPPKRLAGHTRLGYNAPTMATRPKPTKRRTRTPSTQFVVDEKGRRTAVLLSMRAYKRLLQAAEDLDDIRAADEARAEGGEPIPWEEVKAELRAKGVLP